MGVGGDADVFFGLFESSEVLICKSQIAPRGFDEQQGPHLFGGLQGFFEGCDGSGVRPSISQCGTDTR